jgi:hypothetical protein
MYGREGREVKKVDTKSLLLDFELFKNFTTDDFIDEFKKHIKIFHTLLNEEHKQGNKKIFYN